MDVSAVMWHKASRSANNGECVEVGAWHKSSYSGSGNACVEVGAWRKASRSTSNGSCVEVGPCECCGVAVRDSKDPDGPKLAFDAAEWRAFTARIRTGRLDLP
ncbi:DUF397 domain-containing protein [Actinomadura craniellae]|nr:DUF397 domain-containing protein [Actinomadura craniellae]